MDRVSWLNDIVMMSVQEHSCIHVQIFGISNPDPRGMITPRGWLCCLLHLLGGQLCAVGCLPQFVETVVYIVYTPVIVDCHRCCRHQLDADLRAFTLPLPEEKCPRAPFTF